MLYRVSFGYMSKKSDVLYLVDIIRRCFLNGINCVFKFLKYGFIHYFRIQTALKGKARAKLVHNNEQLKLVGIHVYPIKSCGSFNPQHWPISNAGLLYDRKWVIVNKIGAALTQKREPKLCLILPEIDLDKKVLRLRHKTKPTLIEIPLESDKNKSEDLSACFVKTCGTTVKVVESGSEVDEWLSSVLDQPGLRLLKYEESEEKSSLANDAPFLLINKNSAVQLQQQFTSPDLNSLVYHLFT